MRIRWLGAAVALTICVGAGSLLVSTATSAPSRPSHAKPTAFLAAAMRHVKQVRGFDGDFATGTITNATPYSWSFVQEGGIGASPQPRWSATDFPQTLAPGQSFSYRLIWTDHPALTTWSYDGWFTYKAESATGTHYLSVDVFGFHCTGACSGSEDPLSVNVYNSNTQPSYQDGVINFGSPAPKQEIGWTAGGATDVFPKPCCFQGFYTANFDYTFQVQGNYTLDANNPPEQAFADLLNTLCSDAPGTTCTFTPAGDPTYKLGDKTSQGTSDNLDCNHPPSQEARVRLRRTRVNDAPPPPADDADWHEVSVTESRTTGLSLGTQVKAGVKVNIEGIVEAEVAAKVGVESEWKDQTETTKTVRIYLPPDYLGGVWTAPIVGSVNGTLVVSDDQAKWTVVNFSATKPGVSPNLKQPPFEVMTTIRPLTLDEWKTEKAENCNSASAVPPTGRTPAPHVHVTG